jgi:hypothetical protein
MRYSETFPRFIRSPAKKKTGMARRGKTSMPLFICCIIRTMGRSLAKVIERKDEKNRE